MTTGYHLLDKPNPNGEHFYRKRLRPLLAGVVHITAGIQDLDARDDHSAERTAAYASSTDRRVSWHLTADTDTFVPMLPASFTAWHAGGYNSPTWGVEFCKLDTSWTGEPEPFVAGTLRNGVAGIRREPEVLALPRRRATRAELDAAIAHYDRTGEAIPVGWIPHSELDPERRSDPGLDFPWTRFFALLDDLEDDDMFTDTDRALLQEAVAVSKKNGTAITSLGRKGLGWYKHLMFGRPEPGGPDSPGHAGLVELRDQIAALGPGGEALDYERLADLVAERVADKVAARMAS